MGLRISFWSAALFSLLVSTAALAGEGACPRPQPGDRVSRPVSLQSKNGVLDVTLDYRTRVDQYGHKLFCFMTPDGAESPALHVLPGDTLRLRLNNRLPNSVPANDMAMSADEGRCGPGKMRVDSVNLHFHGTNTPPKCHQDDSINTFINPGQTFTYTLQIPPDEPPGLYWYHTHVHGVNTKSLLGGASGPLIVDGISQYQPEVKGLPRRILAFRDEPRVHSNSKPDDPPRPSFDVSLNFVPVIWPGYRPAVLHMRPGQKEFWRVVNASANTSADLEVLYDGRPQPVTIVAYDGVPIGWEQHREGETVTKDHVFLPPAGRAEFIVAPPDDSVSEAELVTLAGHTGTGFHEPPRPLAIIKTSGAPDALPPDTERAVAQNAYRFDGLADAKVTARRKLYFSENAAGTKFFITVVGEHPKLYEPGEKPRITTTHGAVEDWTIENRSTEVHEFHIHQIHFLLLKIDGKPVPKRQQQMFDTYEVDAWSGKGPFPSITLRMDFRGPIVGEFVYHCHITDHSDAGMMANIRVLPNKDDLLAAASAKQPNQ
ncbi:MAG TPA: multicopper oxidase domain-containing protein [Rhizomicrobium sp.]